MKTVTEIRITFESGDVATIDEGGLMVFSTTGTARPILTVSEIEVVLALAKQIAAGFE